MFNILARSEREFTIAFRFYDLVPRYQDFLRDLITFELPSSQVKVQRIHASFVISSLVQSRFHGDSESLISILFKEGFCNLFS